MEPNQFTDADLDNLLRDLNECQKAMSQLSGASGEPTNFIESIFWANNNPNNTNPSEVPSDFHHLTRLLDDDFQEFETEMLPPTPSTGSQRDHFANATTACGSTLDQNHRLAGEIQDSRAMIEEMAANDDPGSSLCFLGNSGDPAAQNLNMDFEAYDFWAACQTGIPSLCPEYAADSYGNVSGHGVQQDGSASGMTFFGCSSVRYFICSEKNGHKELEMKAKKTRCRKRRYKGAVETDEEAAHRVELTKIRNREAAAQAHLRKQCHEAHLQTLLLKLRRKNEFLKKRLKFLQGHKRTNVPPQPLRRSISGPI